MTQKSKLIIGIGVFALVITGAASFYHMSSKQAESGIVPAEQPNSIVAYTPDRQGESDLQENITPLQTEESEMQDRKTPEYRKITAEEAKTMMAEMQNFILLDVRTDVEYKENRIDGAILIPDTEMSTRAETELPDKNALILVYCRSGRRSQDAANELVKMGYTNVYDFGGIIDWPFETMSG